MAKAKAKTPQCVKLYKSKDKAHESFQIVLDGKSITTTIAQPFTSGKPKKQTLATPDKAKARFDQLVADKRAEGYRVLGEIDPPQVAVARNEELEAAIREDRDDPAPYLVYADWLQGQGSPIGEMLVYAQRKKPKQALAIAHKLGLPLKELATFGWKHGLWQWLRLENEIDWNDARWDPVPFARSLFSSPLCVALEELRIGILRWDFNDQPAVLAEAGKYGWAKDLQRLHLGDVQSVDMDHHTIGDVGKVITKHFPNLISLKLHSGSQSWRGSGETFGVAGLELPRLEELVVETCAMNGKRMKALAMAKLPALEKLELWFGARDREGTARIADVVPVLDGKQFPKLRHLGLRNTELVTDIIRLLPDRKVAKQIVSLDLSMSIMTDEDAAELAAEAGKFSALETLDVSENYITAAGARVLKAAFKGVKIDHSSGKEIDEDDDDDGGTNRYVSVHE
ncbi:MAG: TIGR02996 domain-containing protein [Kofleriaceae bacterium]